jgi:peptidyl-prolyl cis-trans isomerase SurA
MKKTGLFICALLLTFTLGTYNAFSALETIDRVVAVVNDEPITQSELDALIVPIYEQYRQAYSGQEFMRKMTEVRTNLLSQLIEDRLVAQEAERLGVVVTDEEIQAQINDVKSKFPSETEFKNFLDEQKISLSKLRERYKDQIAIRKLHQYEIRQKIIVSPKEIEEYYNSNLKAFTEKEKLKVKTIMVRKKESDQTDTDSVQRQLMETIVSELKDGADFASLAKQYSDETHAQDGGDLGFIERGELIATFDEVLFQLSVGSLSPILETEIGYHLFLVEAKQEKKVKPLAELKDEIENILFRTKSKNRFEQWINELKENAYISIK